MLAGFSMGGGAVARDLTRHGAGRIGKAVPVSALTPTSRRATATRKGADASVFHDFVAQLRGDRPNVLATFGKPFRGAGFPGFPASTDHPARTRNLAPMAGLRSALACVRACPGGMAPRPGSR